MSDHVRHARGLLAVNISLVANVFLAAAKIVVGITGYSPGLLADGINSTSDVAFGVVVRVFMKLAGKPPDREHPYGHTQMESIASLVIGSFIITTAIAIFWNAVNSVYTLFMEGSVRESASELALWIALITVVLKLALAVWTKRIGRQTDNVAVMALASDHRNDIFTAIAVSIGIICSRLGFVWVDPLAGAVVSVIILWTGIQILRESSADLMDSVPGQALDEAIRAVVSRITGVEEIEEVHAHRFGPYMMVNITIVIDGDLPVHKGDVIADAVEHALREQITYIRQVYVHYHGCCRDNIV